MRAGSLMPLDQSKLTALADIVPTFCYITGNPVPADAEGAPIYQIMENPNLVD